jgi:hypothetical protein
MSRLWERCVVIVGLKSNPCTGGPKTEHVQEGGIVFECMDQIDGVGILCC